MKWSKVLSGETLDNCESWSLPEVDDEKREVDKGVLTAEAIEVIQKQAYQEAYKTGLEEGRKEGYEIGQKEGFQYGHQEGLTQGKNSIEEICRRFQAVIEMLDQPLKTMDEQIEQELVGLVLIIAKQVIRTEIATQPDIIRQAVQQSIALLPSSARSIVLRLHPEDALFLKEGMQMLDETPTRIEEDASLHRGGCDVISTVSRIDATIETRLKEVICSMLNCDCDDVQDPWSHHHDG